jgi:hypothetical protein
MIAVLYLKIVSYSRSHPISQPFSVKITEIAAFSSAEGRALARYHALFPVLTDDGNGKDRRIP